VSRKYSVAKSFLFAISGLKSALTREPNFRIHVISALLALSAAYFFNFNLLEWLILAITIFLVITFELLNTVLESLVNLISPELSPEAKIAKDVAAAAVLVSAVFSVIVGTILFLPKIISLL
jgi:diacylglycerol kinase